MKSYLLLTEKRLLNKAFSQTVLVVYLKSALNLSASVPTVIPLQSDIVSVSTHISSTQILHQIILLVQGFLWHKSDEREEVYALK